MMLQKEAPRKPHRGFLVLLLQYRKLYGLSITATESPHAWSWGFFIMSSNRIRKTQNEQLNVICQNLNTQ